MNYSQYNAQHPLKSTKISTSGTATTTTSATTTTTTIPTTTTKTSLLNTPATTTATTLKRDSKRKKKQEEDNKIVYSKYFVDDVNKLLEFINEGNANETQNNNNNNKSNKTTKITKTTTIKSTLPITTTTINNNNIANIYTNPNTNSSKIKNSNKKSTIIKKQNSTDVVIDDNDDLKTTTTTIDVDKVEKVLLVTVPPPLSIIIPKEEKYDDGFSIDEIKFLDDNNDFFSNEIKTNNIQEFVTVKGKKTRKFDKTTTNYPKLPQQNEKSKAIILNKNIKQIDNNTKVLTKQSSHNSKDIVTINNKKQPMSYPQPQIVRKNSTDVINKTEYPSLSNRKIIETQNIDKNKTEIHTTKPVTRSNVVENKIIINQTSVEVTDDKKSLKKIRKEILTKKNSSKSVIFLDENSPDDSDVKSTVNTLEGIRFGFGTSDSETDQSDDESLIKTIEEKTDEQPIQQQQQQQQQQQLPIQPLICVTHPSSLHPYFAATSNCYQSINLCYPNLPVFYINQTLNGQVDVDHANVSMANQGIPASTISTSLAPIMSVLPPMENLSINQQRYCISTSSDNTNNILVYDQHYHKSTNLHNMNLARTTQSSSSSKKKFHFI